MDNRKLEQLWREYEPYIRKLCRYKLNNLSAQTDDCVQEVFLALAESLEAGKEIEYPKAWLTRVALNKVGDCIECASREKQRTVQLEEAENAAYDPEELTVGEGEIDSVRAAVTEQLTENERRLLEEYYVSRLKVKKIAELHNTTETNIKQQLFRLRKSVVYLTRKKLSEHNAQNN